MQGTLVGAMEEAGKEERKDDPGSRMLRERSGQGMQGMPLVEDAVQRVVCLPHPKAPACLGNPLEDPDARLSHFRSSAFHAVDEGVPRVPSYNLHLGLEEPQQ